jgi:hypothetical protein
MWVSLCRAVLDDSYLVILAALFLGIAATGLQLVLAPFRDKYPYVILPDMRISGYTPTQLNAFYDMLGPEDCDMYVDTCNWDMFPFIPSYAIVISAGLLQTAIWNGRDPRAAYMGLVMGLADLIETAIQRQGCVLVVQTSNVVRERLPEWAIEVSSAALQVKWILVSLSMGSIVAGTIRAVHIGRISLPFFPKKDKASTDLKTE